jgi:glycosyltransferase involved in cell wall biosynthesis
VYSTQKGITAKFKNNTALRKKALELIKTKNINLIHSRSYPASIIAQKLGKKFSIPFIFDMRGFWADERIDGNIWSLKKPHQRLLYNYFKRKEKQLLRESAQVISLTQAAKDYITTTFNKNVSSDKITVIPCCADLNHFNLENSNQDKLVIRKSLDVLPQQNMIIYLGSIGTWYLLSEMIDIFKYNLKDKPDSVFLIVTQNDHALAIDLLQQKNIKPENYRIKKATRDEVPKYIHAADAALYFIKPAFSKMASSPVKLAELMGCGLPVIANAGIGDVDIHAKQNDQLILVNELSEKGYTKALKQLAELEPNPVQNRKFALENYSLEMGIEHYSKVYKKILNK